MARRYNSVITVRFEQRRTELGAAGLLTILKKSIGNTNTNF